MDVREVNKRVVEQFRAGGAIDGMHRERLLLLTTTGRRTGEPRTTPMMFHRDGDRVLVIASNIGAPRHPDWYLNLVAPAGSPAHISTAQLPAGRTGEPAEYVQYEARSAGTPSGNLDPPIYALASRRGPLVAHPEATVEVGDESGAPRPVVARSLEGAERTAVWEMLKAAYPFFAEHEAATTRTIPVVELLRRPES